MTSVQVRSPYGIISKLTNVSNRANQTLDPKEFLRRLLQWDPIRDRGSPPPHPHPFFAQTFTQAETVPNWFEIPDVFTEGMARGLGRELLPTSE